MLSVALIGPDGAGKTTISRQLEQSLPVPAKYVYMGVNLGSSNVLLPTSRLIVWVRNSLRWRSDTPAMINERVASASESQRRGIVRRLLKWLRSYMRLINLLAEECFRHSLVWCYQRAGKVVLLDRWFFADYHAYERTNDHKQPLNKRIHHLMLQKVYPKPDLVIYLNAPAATLFERKREGTLESLERSHQRYLGLHDVVQQFVVIDASQPTEQVAADVTAAILDCYTAKITGKVQPIMKGCRQYES